MGEWEITFNYTLEVATQLKAMITAYEGMDRDTAGECMWFEVWSPQNTEAFFVIAQPPHVLPMPEMGQNELQTIAVTLSIENYKGTDTGVMPA